MNETVLRVTSNKKIALNTYLMKLDGDCSAVTVPGQFVNISLSGFYLRRPISVCDYTSDSVTLIYKVVGGGTALMSELQPGAKLNVLTGLGNGYDDTLSGGRPLLVGGGAGVPPLYSLAKKLTAQGKKVMIILGFNTADEVFGEEEFRETGAEVFLTTVDGSAGTKGFVTDVMKELDYTYFYTCGPMPMLRAVDGIAVTDGQFSFEERMGCGFGACMGCSCKTKYGYKRICRDGPVLKREEIVW
ncbi:MAG: dihydroorotate dehydrogenase electron transfer subunit [Clostridia bacterium]|nr:dihydroorotate dehydrogenase electron transfer subunit [Clostridia bacterium]